MLSLSRTRLNALVPERIRCHLEFDRSRVRSTSGAPTSESTAHRGRLGRLRARLWKSRLCLLAL
jgi:hypothetical protein